jgi:hypothetical protein
VNIPESRVDPDPDEAAESFHKRASKSGFTNGSLPEVGRRRSFIARQKSSVQERAVKRFLQHGSQVKQALWNWSSRLKPGVARSTLYRDGVAQSRLTRVAIEVTVSESRSPQSNTKKDSIDVE